MITHVHLIKDSTVREGNDEYYSLAQNQKTTVKHVKLTHCDEPTEQS